MNSKKSGAYISYNCLVVYASLVIPVTSPSLSWKVAFNGILWKRVRLFEERERCSLEYASPIMYNLFALASFICMYINFVYQHYCNSFLPNRTSTHPTWGICIVHLEEFWCWLLLLPSSYLLNFLSKLLNRSLPMNFKATGNDSDSSTDLALLSLHCWLRIEHGVTWAIEHQMLVGRFSDQSTWS